MAYKLIFLCGEAGFTIHLDALILDICGRLISTGSGIVIFSEVSVSIIAEFWKGKYYYIETSEVTN